MPSAKGIRAGRAFVELFADDSKLVRGLRRAQKKLKAFGQSIRNMGLKIAGLGAAMLAPLIGAAKAFSSMGDQVAKMAKRTGMSVEALSELQFVASQPGTEINALENALRRMQRSIYDAGRGLSTAVDALADLGLTFKDFDGLSPEQQFKLLADRISQIEDPTRKAAIAMSLLGRSGTALLPMFAKGAAGIEALQKEARRLGLTMSAEDAAAAEHVIAPSHKPSAASLLISVPFVPWPAPRRAIRSGPRQAARPPLAPASLLHHSRIDPAQQVPLQRVTLRDFFICV